MLITELGPRWKSLTHSEDDWTFQKDATQKKKPKPNGHNFFTYHIYIFRAANVRSQAVHLKMGVSDTHGWIWGKTLTIIYQTAENRTP